MKKWLKKLNSKENVFYIWCAILLAIVTFLLLNYWYNFICAIHLDKYSILLLITAIGISLLPFAEKIKIGNFLEIERLKVKIDEINLTRYLGEVIKNSYGDIYYYDDLGKHTLPDNLTADFLKTNKGEITVPQEVLDKMSTGLPIDSVTTARKIRWGKHHFIILNNKKYYISMMSYFNDWGMTESQIDNIENLTDKELRLIPTAK